ncbi:hypothetical protein ACFYT4_03205 [Streptomyces sp. NPDC004609]
MPALPWISLAALGLLSAAALHGLDRTGRLAAPVSPPRSELTST